MSIPDDQLFDDLIDGLDMQKSFTLLHSLSLDHDDITYMDFANLQGGSLDDFLEPFKIDEDFTNMLSPLSVSYDSYTPSSSDSSFNDNSTCDCLEIIDQPCQSSKLRYRTDYIREKDRVGALGNKNKKSKFKGPVVRIPECYLNSPNEYYIRVSLVTVKYSKTNLHYFHPYELEHAKKQSLNDRKNNSVWFPIDSKDAIKSFPFLRIVKKKSFQVQKLDYLRTFDYHNELLENATLSQHHLQNESDVIKEFRLEKSQLAFTIGEKVDIDGQSTIRLHLDTTVFSDPMDEHNPRQSDTDTDSSSTSSDQTITSSFNDYIYKYAPRSGPLGGNEEMLVFLNKDFKINKQGNVQVIFESPIPKNHWSERITNLDIRHRMISFKIPTYPYRITKPTSVDITVQQDDCVLGTLKYCYLPVRQLE